VGVARRTSAQAEDVHHRQSVSRYDGSARYQGRAGRSVLIAIYETAGGKTRFVHKKPSTLMSSLKNAELHEAALELDAKMLALPESSTDANA
jgi:hypothetical protein